MKLFDRFSIKSKLSILFIILCCSVFIFGFISINTSENSKERLKKVYINSEKVLLLQDNIIAPLYRLREGSQSMVIAPNRNQRLIIKKDLDLLIKQLDKSIYQFKIGKEKTSLLWEEYKKIINKTQYYFKRNFEEGAYINVSTRDKVQFNLLIKQLHDIQAKLLNNAKNSYNTAVNESKLLVVEITLYFFVIMAFSILAGWFVSNNIITSLNIVQRGLNEFFEYLNYKKDKTQKIIIHSKDEFFYMAESINKNFINVENNIKKNEIFIKDATKVLKNIQSGNLGMRLTKDSDSSILNELKVMMNNMINNLEYKIQEEIDKRIEQEQILIQQSKLASMGEMIGNIAHQWRQPLSEISSIHMNMLATYEFNEFDQKYLEEKIDEADKLTQFMTQTISDFQNFFKPEEEKKYFNVKETCKKAFYIIKSSLKYHNIDFIMNVIDDVEVNGYENEYSQVILNILNNAKDVLILRKVAEPQITIEIKNGKEFNIVKIEDNAGGIDTNIIEKIFEPYFTTKHKAQGTGIGLYMSKNIIETNMNGLIDVRNTEKGACFTVKVPI